MLVFSGKDRSRLYDVTRASLRPWLEEHRDPRERLLGPGGRTDDREK